MTVLSNGNYVVSSPYWDNGAIAEAGAATWGDGTSGTSGAVSDLNSLVGSTADDRVGNGGVTALSNGNYVVRSPSWDNGAIADAGAATWGDGASGVSGAVSDLNSLVGSTADDRVGYYGATALSSGNYVVSSPYWDNGAIADAGAVTWGDGGTGIFGPITSENSVRGTATGGGEYMNFGYDDVNVQLVVGRPYDNIVTLFRPNRAPLADAGADQTVVSQATVTLDGSASNDPDGNLPLAYSWEQSGGTPVTLSGSGTANPTFTAPQVITQTAVLTFTLVVSDSLGMSSLPDEVVISAAPYSALLPLILKQY